jgi:hypothetical protein
MPLGIKQNNSLQRITLDVWQDLVFLNEQPILPDILRPIS